ncbi:MAG: protein kinase [Acetatifactor sp.]
MFLINKTNHKTYEVEGPIYTNELTKIWCGKTSGKEGKRKFVKILRYGELTEPQIATALRNAFREEADTLKLVSGCSDAVPRLYDAWDDTKSRRYIIIMSLAPGISLRDWINSRKKDQLQAKDIVARKSIIVQLCRIMQSINQKYPVIVHRDLKPENIQIDFNRNTRKWDVYIIDFGCANLNCIRGVGTMDYQAPEQLGIKSTTTSVNAKTDIFAMGQIFYELLLGAPPKINEDYLYKSSEGRWIQIPKLDEYLLQISGVDMIEQVLQKMTSFRQEDRPTYGRIIANLNSIKVG